jgi:hypothetical protein
LASKGMATAASLVMTGTPCSQSQPRGIAWCFSKNGATENVNGRNAQMYLICKIYETCDATFSLMIIIGSAAISVRGSPSGT